MLGLPSGRHKAGPHKVFTWRLRYPALPVVDVGKDCKEQKANDVAADEDLQACLKL